MGLEDKVLEVTKLNPPKKFKNTPNLIDQSKDEKGMGSRADQCRHAAKKIPHKEDSYSRPVCTKAALCFLNKFLNLACSQPMKVIPVFLIQELLYIDTK